MVSLMQYRAMVGLLNIHLKAKEYSRHERRKFWSMLLFMFYLKAIYLSMLKKSNQLVANKLLCKVLVHSNVCIVSTFLC